MARRGAKRQAVIQSYVLTRSGQCRVPLALEDSGEIPAPDCVEMMEGVDLQDLEYGEGGIMWNEGEPCTS